MKYISLLALLVLPIFGLSQYTDVINSNRPGLSVSAYAVGRNVIQFEAGAFYEQSDHSLLNTQANIWGGDFSLRYGLLFEPLEINWEGTYQNNNVTYTESGQSTNLTNFTRNRLGLKYLLYDRYKSEERNKPNLYSWKANYGFKFKNLIPSVALYGGATFNLGNNPFYIGDPSVSYRAMVATQSRLTPRFVLITNIAYDRITAPFPELSYLISLSHGFRNPKWSVFVEHQGIDSDRYSDALIRGGVAYLFTDDLQADLNMGASFKDTPSKIFVQVGASYRIDLHKDKVKAIEDQEAGENGGPIKKNAMKKKKKDEKKAKKNGTGAEDIDLGPSKKQLRKLKKAEKKKNKGKKKKKNDGGEIDF